VTGLRWRIYRRCGCPLCLRWPPQAAAASWLGCAFAIWAVAVLGGSGLGFVPEVAVAGAVSAAAAVVFSAWPRADHSGDDIEALINATSECRACSPEDCGPCRCTEPCGNIRCTVGDWLSAADFGSWQRKRQLERNEGTQ
jgi:hypothetical protein